MSFLFPQSIDTTTLIYVTAWFLIGFVLFVLAVEIRYAINKRRYVPRHFAPEDDDEAGRIAYNRSLAIVACLGPFVPQAVLFDQDADG